MERLHAYWRMEYIKAPKDSDERRNPFAFLPGKGNDREALIVHRDRHSFLIMNKYPYNPGHLMAVPYREVGDLSDLEPDELSNLMSVLVLGKEILAKAIKPDGFNIGFNLGDAGGAGIPSHVHGHIVPRWGGDTNFMPVIGKTRVLPQALEQMWEQLRQPTVVLPEDE